MTTLIRSGALSTASASASMNRAATSGDVSVEQLLELIDEQHQPAHRRGRERTRPRAGCHALPPAPRASDDGGSTATARNASSSCSKGWTPGVISTMNHSSEPSRPPERSAGSTPAFTTLDLPLPLGPTTATKLPARPLRPRRARTRSTKRSRPKKFTASLCSKLRRPRYGFWVTTVTMGDPTGAGSSESSRRNDAMSGADSVIADASSIARWAWSSLHAIGRRGRPAPPGRSRRRTHERRRPQFGMTTRSRSRPGTCHRDRRRGCGRRTRCHGARRLDGPFRAPPRPGRRGVPVSSGATASPQSITSRNVLDLRRVA